MTLNGKHIVLLFYWVVLRKFKRTIIFTLKYWIAKNVEFRSVKLQRLLPPLPLVHSRHYKIKYDFNCIRLCAVFSIAAGYLLIWIDFDFTNIPTSQQAINKKFSFEPREKHIKMATKKIDIVCYLCVCVCVLMGILYNKIHGALRLLLSFSFLLFCVLFLYLPFFCFVQLFHLIA